MKAHRPRWLTILAVFLSGATLYQIGGVGCPSFGANAAYTAINWCWILDCQNGLAGGLIQLCDPTNSSGNILVDCPGSSSSTTNTTTTTTGTST